MGRKTLITSSQKEAIKEIHERIKASKFKLKYKLVEEFTKQFPNTNYTYNQLIYQLREPIKVW
jgi:hypothetical protein